MLMDEKVKFTEDSYEKAVIKLFTELGYEYECGYDLDDRDEELPYYDGLVLKCLQRLKSTNNRINPPQTTE